VETLSFYEALVNDYNLPKRGFGISNLYIELGFYSEAVKRYLEIFGKENVKILVFEEFTQNTRESVVDVLRFLGIDSPAPDNVDTAYNSFFVPRNGIVMSVLRNPTIYKAAGALPPSVVNKLRGNRVLFKNKGKPKISAKESEFLTGIYKDDVRALESIFGRSLPWLKN
jgi:hypothetical protein